MRSPAKEQREEQIAKAAYTLMEEKGFQGLSMLAVAKGAKASNETLYRWYGDKSGLFRSLIQRNAKQVGDGLDAALDHGLPPRETLRALGPELLSMLLSKRAIALNRAAAADASNTLGAVLAEAGRGQIFPRITKLFEALVVAGDLQGPAQSAAAIWVDLLVGDWQVRCVTGAMAVPDAPTQLARAHSAETLLFQLRGAD
ncbi:TetR/AcrR family transcriptional regulator [Pelagimonas varians]|uniref:Bacterial regulatory proteins, tetR family n=1 Tax=Pelagimonas varians TaxID=696760 RepID=A0A238KXN6_9RHOB|nr:TetR/AcrR family transcriptional regulator [Pelagimonas varians]PYG27799.1 TetR family transcriptional regulator [Pelagimonas varians]SMX47575.1 Bacterial regulatory proteins, tetR family [Pelagimonas varians]